MEGELSVEEAEELRARAVQEIARKGFHHVSGWHGIPADALRQFLAGAPPTQRVLFELRRYYPMEYPALSLLLGSSFTEDYSAFGPAADWESVVDRELAHSPVRTAAVLEDITRLLCEVPNDDDLDAMLTTFGCLFLYDSVPITQRNWLLAMRDHLRTLLERDASSRPDPSDGGEPEATTEQPSPPRVL